MPYVMRRATESSQSEWRSIPDGVWRFEIGKPEVRLNERFGKQEARIPLMLTEGERTRLMAEYPLEQAAVAEGTQQSWRSNYSAGLSLGYMDDKGQYKSTKLTDFMAAAFGHTNSKNFRNWIVSGGGPPRPPDKDDQAAELLAIQDWLGWLEGLEVLGSIRSETDKNDRVWARFGGPIAIGSMPGQREEEYQAHGRGKLRAMIAESEGGPVTLNTIANRPASGPAERFTAAGAAVAEPADDELPF